MSYGTMVLVRCLVVMYTAFHFRRAVTIAVRYSAVRRQVCNCKAGQGLLPWAGPLSYHRYDWQ